MSSFSWTRSLRIRVAPFVFGFLISIPIGTEAFADLKEVVDRRLNEAIANIQMMVAKTSTNCPGESHGVNILNWEAFNNVANAGVKALNDVRVSVVQGNKQQAASRIDTAIGAMSEMIRLADTNCSGGRNGININNWGLINNIRTETASKLDLLKDIIVNS